MFKKMQAISEDKPRQNPFVAQDQKAEKRSGGRLPFLRNGTAAAQKTISLWRLNNIKNRGSSAEDDLSL